MTKKALLALASIGMAAAVGLHCGGNDGGSANNPDGSTNAGSSGKGGTSAGSGGAGQSGAGGAGQSGGTGGAGSSGNTDAGSPPKDGGTTPAIDAPVTPVTCDQLPKLKLTSVAKADSPLLLIQPPGDPRMYVVERRGFVRILRNNKLEAQAFFELSPRPPTDGERGLLGLAFHPQYMQNGRFFLYYSAADGDIVIAEGKRSDANPDRADAAVKTLFTVEHSTYSNHNGGMIAFGRDGMLYAGTGDGGSAGDPFKSGQDTKNRLGKMLRIDVDKPNERAAGNMPAPADMHVWGYGLRNPWRWSFDMMTGDMYIGDVGQGTREEVDFVPVGSPAGLNFGWSEVEGTECYRMGCVKTGTVVPITDYLNPPGEGDNQRSITGGFVYRGSAIPCLRGRYFYADYVTNQIFSLVVENGKATKPLELTADLREGGLRLGGIPGFGQDAQGEVYVLTLDGGDIYRIDAE